MGRKQDAGHNAKNGQREHAVPVSGRQTSQQAEDRKQGSPTETDRQDESYAAG